MEKNKFMSKLKDKKGQALTSQLLGFAFAGIAFVVLVIVLSVGGLINGNVQKQVGNISGTSSVGYQIATAGNTGLLTLGNFLPTIATIVAAVLIIGLLFGLFSVGALRGENRSA